MALLVKIPKTRPWTAEDLKRLPNLRRHEHRDDWGGSVFPLRHLQCPHGVYVPNAVPLPEYAGYDAPDPLDFALRYGDEGELVEWQSPYCTVCYAEWVEHEARVQRDGKKKIFLLKDLKLIRPRKLEAGEFQRREGKLFDGAKVYPETFTLRILRRGRTPSEDLRLTVDPDTGQRRLETMGGYVMSTRGYGKADRGHGPDTDADNIRRAWMAEGDGSPEGVGSDESTAGPADWSATLPKIAAERNGSFQYTETVITEQNWMPYSWPTRSKFVHCTHCGGAFEHTPTNPAYMGGLEEDEYFDERKPNGMPPDIMRARLPYVALNGCGPLFHQNISSRVKLFDGTVPVSMPLLTPNAKYRIDNIRKPDSARARSFTKFYLPLPTVVVKQERRDQAPPFHHNPLYRNDGAPLNWMEAPKRPKFPAWLNEQRWFVPIEWFRDGCYRVAERELKTDMFIGPVYRVPCKVLRRSPRWKSNWRTDRNMRDLASKLNMYRKDNGNRVNDCVVQSAEMCATANENHRKAVLAVSPAPSFNHAHCDNHCLKLHVREFERKNRKACQQIFGRKTKKDTLVITDMRCGKPALKGTQRSEKLEGNHRLSENTPGLLRKLNLYLDGVHAQPKGSESIDNRCVEPLCSASQAAQMAAEMGR